MRTLRKDSGQTLIIAILILGVLLTLGLVFAGIIAQNVILAGRSQQRTIGSDLAEAGVRYAHYQMLNSELGADWRPEFTPPTTDANGFTKDPDALFLRPKSGFPLRNDADTVIDQGGPDGLGPYTRIQFSRGRALVRVRFAPSDFNLFSSPTGPLRQPGRARTYTMIEVVGRPGALNPNDPSLQLAESVKVMKYADSTDFRTSLGKIRRIDTRIIDTRKLIAFASIGIIESGRFISNKFNVARPAELGSLWSPTNANDAGPSKEGLGVLYEGRPVQVPSVWGGEYIPGQADLGTGSLFSNADVVIHGKHDVFLNPEIGDMWAINGKLRGANDQAELRITRTSDGQTISIGNNTPGSSLNSDRSTFTTFRGLLRDRREAVDPEGYARMIGRKEPPSIQATDPASGLNRYVQMTRNSGVQRGRRNTGEFGYGRGVYVDANERGNVPSEEERNTNEVSKALVNDWLNPNSGSSLGWQGPYYRPITPYLRLTPDGFVITRDSRSRQRFWRNDSGGFTGTSRCRFRLRDINGQTYILNSIQSPNLIERPASSLSDSDFITFGQPFNGVLYFEGDVRVRGVIPTDKQLTVVSMGTIYIEGSITKGIVTESGATLSQPSRSMLMLMSKDFIALNTTSFFAPAPGDDTKTKFGDPASLTPNSLEVGLDEAQVSNSQLNLQAQFLLNPLNAGGQPEPNPQNWRPYALQYVPFGGGGGAWNPEMLITQSADSGGPSYISLAAAALTFEDQAPPLRLFAAYLFARAIDFGVAGIVQLNGAAGFFSGTGNVPIYGLATPARNAYPAFETLSTVLVRAGFGYNNRKLAAPGGNQEGAYLLGAQDESVLQLRLTSVGQTAPKNYLLARTAISPHDVRIEAAVFAEEGSFFVIPGPAFNFKPQDTRENFDADITRFMNQGFNRGDATLWAQRRRLELHGNMPNVPFFGESLDVRITLFGAISENMPAPIGQQAEWQKRWGWIPRYIGASGAFIPSLHVPKGYDLNGVDYYVPNLITQYDPALATDTADGLNPIRLNKDGWILPPMPRLPVSPTLAYFGELNQ